MSEFLPGGVSEERTQHVQGVFVNITDMLASFYLLPALAFCLTLRRRAVDLSVWAVAGLGGVLAAKLINAQMAPGLAFAAVTAVGAIIGGLNAAAVVFARRLPIWLITLATALGAMWLASAFVGQGERSLQVPRETFSNWHVVQEVVVANADEQGLAAPQEDGDETAGQVVTQRKARSPAVTRMLMIASVYAAVMISLIVWGSIERHKPQPPRAAANTNSSARNQTVVALVASGAIASLGGAIWLIEHGAAPLLTRPIGDLRIPAAAILAGAGILTGQGRSLLAGLLLPGSLLLVTLWRQEVRPWSWVPTWGYCLPLVMLIGMLATVQCAFHRALKSTQPVLRLLFAAPGVAAVIALAVTAWQVRVSDYDVRSSLNMIGVIVWLLAMTDMFSIMFRRGAWPRCRRHA